MLQKQNGRWLTAAAQNIDSRPEVYVRAWLEKN
jgi:hypothetical protein